jgi:protein gp37
MPDGNIAICYAETIANKFEQHYPEGFEHDYWYPERLDEPGKLKNPSRIFVDSMGDLFGHWVDEDQISQVMSVIADNPRHTFQLLTKNPKRALNMIDAIPKNAWVGASSPPSFFMGKELSEYQQQAMAETSLATLALLKQKGITTWMSIEPHPSWPFHMSLWHYRKAIDWAVVGAASNGPKYYQPDPQYLYETIHELDMQNVAVFYKGNLRPSFEAGHLKTWREEFPT